MHTVTIIVDKKFYSVVTKQLEDMDIKVLDYAKKELDDNLIKYTSETSNSDFIYDIAELLTNCIINVYEFFLLNKIISKDYINFNVQEKKKIMHVAKEIIDGNDSVVDKVFFIKRKNYIYKRLVDYLSKNEVIRLEGFIIFRLKDYKSDLELILEKAVDVYLTDKEYNEFINLLKYFIEVQESRIDVVHLTIYANGDFKLCDKFERDISYLYIDDMREELLNSKLTKEDILLGALITISPQKIILNRKCDGKISKEIFNTINSVFTDRISIHDPN
ncbi:MAG: putative sporulation protein YtxC [Clostridiales bacterium]|nr:putative sporulation protein YtxC [Clostridiales bacterium]